MAKNIYMYFKYCSIYKCNCGALAETRTDSPEIAESRPICVVWFSQGIAYQPEDYACGVFWEALRHICVTAGA
jgi:hypothetical protein